MHKNRVVQHNDKKCDSKNNREDLGLSPILMEMAKRELEEFEARSDEAFLLRAEMDRKLSSL